MSEPTVRSRVGMTAIWNLDGAIFFQAGMQIDVDGAPNAYHPPTASRPISGRPPGLDAVANAGAPGNWWGIVVKENGDPAVQVSTDPYPGFYISTTALGDHSLSEYNPRRYVDSVSVPYISLPKNANLGVELGDVGIVFYQREWCPVIYADVGPSRRIGEGSIALATALGIYHGVNDGHDKSDIVYLVFPESRSSPPWPRSNDNVHADVMDRFTRWGGVERLGPLVPHLIWPKSEQV